MQAITKTKTDICALRSDFLKRSTLSDLLSIAEDVGGARRARELAELCTALEAAKTKNDEQVKLGSAFSPALYTVLYAVRCAVQMSEICLLSRRIDQLQARRAAERRESGGTVAGPHTFIIRDLQGQLQQLEERNVKKVELISGLGHHSLVRCRMR